MATTKELSVEEKLRALYDLQIIDTRIDEIRNVRGELPLEVEDLEDEVAGLTTRLEKLQTDLVTIEYSIKAKKVAIENHQVAIKKYTEQQIKDINSRGIDVFFDEGDFLFYSRYGQYVLSSRDIRRVNSQNCLRIGILQKIIERKPDVILFLT